MRGLRDFAETITAAWTDESPAAGRGLTPDAQEEASCTLHHARRQGLGMADRRAGEHDDGDHGAGKRGHRP